MDETNVVLAKRDERYIEKRIAHIRKELLEGNTTISDGKTFTSVSRNGEGPLPPEAIESVIEAISYCIRLVKIQNKKYPPKKYRK